MCQRAVFHGDVRGRGTSRGGVRASKDPIRRTIRHNEDPRTRRTILHNRNGLGI